MGKCKFLTSFAPVTSTIQTYYLCLTQEQVKKCLTLQEQQEVHHTLLNCSLFPRAASLLLLIPGRNRPVCVADVPKDKAVAIMSSLTNALLETTMSTCLCAQCEKASWGRQMIIAAYKTRDSSFPHKKREKLEKKEAITVFILCSFASPTQFQGNKKIIVLS